MPEAHAESKDHPLLVVARGQQACVEFEEISCSVVEVCIKMAHNNEA